MPVIPDAEPGSPGCRLSSETYIAAEDEHPLSTIQVSLKEQGQGYIFFLFDVFFYIVYLGLRNVCLKKTYNR